MGDRGKGGVPVPGGSVGPCSPEAARGPALRSRDPEAPCLAEGARERHRGAHGAV